MNRRAFLNLAGATMAGATVMLDYAIGQTRRDGLLGAWSLLRIGLPDSFPYELRSVNSTTRLELDRDLLTDIGFVRAFLDGEPLGILGLDAEGRAITVLLPRELRAPKLRETRERTLRLEWPGGLYEFPITTTPYLTAPAWNRWNTSNFPVSIVQDETGLYLWQGQPLTVRPAQVVQMWCEGIIAGERARRAVWLEVFNDGWRERVTGSVHGVLVEGQSAFTFAPPPGLAGRGRCQMVLCTMDAQTDPVEIELL